MYDYRNMDVLASVYWYDGNLDDVCLSVAIDRAETTLEIKMYYDVDDPSIRD